MDLSPYLCYARQVTETNGICVASTSFVEAMYINSLHQPSQLSIDGTHKIVGISVVCCRD